MPGNDQATRPWHLLRRLPALGFAPSELIPALLREDLDPRLRFSGRNRRPPKDCFNALLSFGYAMVYRDVVQAILAVGLEPAFGLFHQPRSTSHPRALDVTELFRVPMWDMPVVAWTNRLQWDPDADFSYARPQVRTTAGSIR